MPAVARRVSELALPAPGARQRFRDLLERSGKYRLQELMRDLAERLVPSPSIELLGAAIPVGDLVARIADENRVVREFEELHLLTLQFLQIAQSPHEARDGE